MNVYALRRVVAALVYAVGIALGAGVLTVSPLRPLLGLPLAAAVALPVHALWNFRLAELGRAVLWLWVAVLGLVVVGTASALLPVETVPLIESRPLRVSGTVALVAVVGGAYLRDVFGGA